MGRESYYCHFDGCLRPDHRDDWVFSGNAHQGRHRGCGLFGNEFGRPIFTLRHSGRRYLGEIHPGVLSMMHPQQEALLAVGESAATLAIASSGGKSDGPAVILRGLHKSFGSQIVLDGIALTVESGETLAVLGRSGT